VATAFHEGGWSYADLAAGFAEAVGELQSVGEKFPPLPEALQRS
jgi:3-oxoacyl-[acyl-carrier protein] reductase